MDEVHDRMSPSQKEVIATSAWENIERLANSKTFEATRRDADLFGEEAVFKRGTPCEPEEGSTKMA
jgi:hypothetical protein